MGDGRYYSWSQFSVVAFLTLFMISISISLVLCFYQDFSKNGLKIKLIHFFLGMGTVLRFAEEVLVSYEISSIAKYGEFFCLIICLWTISGLMERKSMVIEWIYRIFSFFTGSFLLISLFKRELLIKSYDFFTPDLGLYYQAVLVLWFLYSFSGLFSLKRKTSFFFFFILPIGINLGSVFFNIGLKDLAPLILYPSLLFCVNYIFADLKAYRIGGDVFSNINDLINDPVLILDPDDKIIYRNQDALDAVFLNKDAKWVEDGNPETIFKENYSREYKYNIETFTSNSGDTCLDYRIKDIYKGKRLKGRSLVFSDITDHINMLDIQAEQKESLEKLNAKLNQYSNIVFDLEKEKEVSYLLKGITMAQEEFMEEFGNKIKDLSDFTDIKNFNSRVDSIIEEAKANLAHIRKVVSRYRRYYGTGD